MRPQRSRDNWVFVIALFKLLKGALLMAAGIGVLRLMHKDVAEVAQHWIGMLRIDPDNRFIHTLLAKLWSVDDRTLKRVSAGTFCYAALFLTEGTGLLLGKRWAKYLTIIVTGSFLPIEVYELVRDASILKMVAILLNAAIVVYLVIHLRGIQRSAHTGAAPIGW
jgi:uncharacterized membrane protein (DUF2068 family)